jgi:hypothetical protein
MVPRAPSVGIHPRPITAFAPRAVILSYGTTRLALGVGGPYALRIADYRPRRPRVVGHSSTYQTFARAGRRRSVTCVREKGLVSIPDLRLPSASIPFLPSSIDHAGWPPPRLPCIHTMPSATPHPLHTSPLSPGFALDLRLLTDVFRRRMQDACSAASRCRTTPTCGSDAGCHRGCTVGGLRRYRTTYTQ